MALPTSPSGAFASILGSPMGPMFPTAEAQSPSSMSGTINWEPTRQRLLGTDLTDALEAASELLGGIEIVHTREFPLMLSALLPAFSTILGHKTQPNADTLATEHKLRNKVLEIIRRMPNNEILRPHAPHLIAVALDVLNRDFEENALLASRIIFDLYKTYRTLPQDYVQPYLDFVQDSYRILPTSVQQNFSIEALTVTLSTGTSTPSPSTRGGQITEAPTTQNLQGESKNTQSAQPMTPGPPNTTTDKEKTMATPPSSSSVIANSGFSKIPVSPSPRISPKSNVSFRVLTECPLIVMLIFQLYPKFLRSNIPALISVMMEALAIRAPPVKRISADAPLTTNMKRLYSSRCRELVAAQAKTLSFLTYLLRGFSNDLKPYEDRLANNVVALMSTCPREFISTRKELLVATRHLLNSDFRNGFVRHVDALLDERVLMGSHHRYSEQAILRPLGYTTLSDLVHHVRGKLNLNQISRVVSIFSRVLHDSSLVLPVSTQYTAVRTLLSVVEIVFNNKDRDPQIGRDILVRILRTLVDKLEALHSCRRRVEEKAKRKQAVETNHEMEEKTKSLIDQLELPVGSDVKESIRDLKSMIRAVIVGHKTLIWYINKYRGQRDKEKIEPLKPGTNEEVSSAMLKITHTEQALIDRYILLAFPCMKWLKDEDSTDMTGVTLDHYRDALSYFAAAFTVLDGYDLRRTLGRRLQELVDAVTDDSAVLVVPRHLLAANAATSYELCSSLLTYLVERIDMLGADINNGIHFVSIAEDDEMSDSERARCWRPENITADHRTKRASAHLQLFERVLKSLATFPENEKALRPHLKQIVSKCLQACTEKTDYSVDNHCMLLRYVFRSISAGKFEESYRELLPLIPTVLNGLFRVFRATDDAYLHHTIVELLLTIPARLSSLLPHMNLLLRIITSALKSESGDLVNLGLRTLEFWVDNLNPEFLYPEITKQMNLFVELTQALSIHLKPAPYPYGLLTLRLLGKLGGRNRRVLREPMNLKDPSTFREHTEKLRLEFRWTVKAEGKSGNLPDKSTLDPQSFFLPFSIDWCIMTIRKLLIMPESKIDPTKQNCQPVWSSKQELLKVAIEDMDFVPYCYDVIGQTRKSQAEAVLVLLRTAMNEFVTVNSLTYSDETNILNVSSLKEGHDSFEKVMYGLILACAIDPIRDASLVLAKGFLAHLFFVVTTHQKNFIRIDANGSNIGAEDNCENVEIGNDIFTDAMGSLKPFGYFMQSGNLCDAPNPLVVNNSIAEILADSTLTVQAVGLELVDYVLDISYELVSSSTTNPKKWNRGCLVFLENLLSVICEKCITSKWNRQDGLFQAICRMLKKLGGAWGRKYELEIMNVTLHALKGVPREMAMTSMQIFRFAINICSALYGDPAAKNNAIFVDILNSTPSAKEGSIAEVKMDVEENASNLLEKSSSADKSKKEATDSKISATTKESASEEKCDYPASEKSGENIDEKSVIVCPSQAVVELLIVELASTKQLLRFASRYIFKRFVMDGLGHSKAMSLLKTHMALLKRVLFSRSLRLLPLPEQAGAVEALAFLVNQLPELLPLNDQHLLAFLSELLKMSSVADGEMVDSNLTGSVVDKNGYAVTVVESANAAKRESTAKSQCNPASAIFLRRDCLLTVEGSRFFVPREASTGVQLRTSTIHLLRAVIRGHADPFFDAESSTPIGNIRPHVISLLFRSLVSRPLECVNASHDALRDVLGLSVVVEDGKSKSRLRKELLQTCIRPVLLNLRDYTRLSVHLLRGLSRLLSLLASWFNKTLGEKLLDHLQKWTEPARIRAQQIWTEGSEPDVAAAIIGLFFLLPHASHFVEPLVKTTIKLEACLPMFQTNLATSPYRKPLARYLNKHCQNTVAFFLQRLKTPLYNEMFQDILALPDSTALREFLKSSQSSVSLLNVCYERPLAIIRSEKAAVTGHSPVGSSQSTKNILHLHGIRPFVASPTYKELRLKQDLDTKRKKLNLLQQDLNRAKEQLNAKMGSSSTPTSEFEESKRKHRQAKLAFDRGTKEFNESRQKYATEVAQIKAAQAAAVPESTTARPMTVETMELQSQGFRIIRTLIDSDQSYLASHGDVLRAFRWLWRSKGRLLRLQHEDAVPPRYHDESKLLASMLVGHSESSSSDVDLLFELLRIFLQPSSSDFSFVRSALEDAVNGLTVEQKGQVIQRLFVLLSGESTEEVKTLSIQLVVYPVLHVSFHSKQDSAFPDPSLPRRLVNEVMFKDGNHVSCGERLKVEILKIMNLLLEFRPTLMKPEREKVVKYCLSLLKSEDVSCKSWAYLVLCRCISVAQTTPKLILQIYGALIRSYQPEERDTIKAALALLLPEMEKCLNDDEMHKALEFTNRIIFEEGNTIPQLAHIWMVVVSHPKAFYSNRRQIVRCMINSLSRMGLPPSSPTETRALSISVVELVLEWYKKDKEASGLDHREDFNSTRLQNISSAFKGVHVNKKQKTDIGVIHSTNKQQQSASPLFDKNMADILINYIVRLKLLLGDPRTDNGPTQMAPKIDVILSHVLCEWKDCRIKAAYFDKLFTTCQSFNAKHRIPDDKGNRSMKGTLKSRSGNKPKMSSAQNSVARIEDAIDLDSSMLCSCLDVFIALAEAAPENSFLTENTTLVCEILSSCFYFARKSKEAEIRCKLKAVVVLFLTSHADTSQIDERLSQNISIYIERLLIRFESFYKKSSNVGSAHSDPGRQSTRPSSSSTVLDALDECTPMFVVEIIKEVNKKKASYFKPFTSALLSVLTIIVKRHTMSSTKQKQGTVTYSSQIGSNVIRPMYYTSTYGILSEYVSNAGHPISRSSISQTKEPFPVSLLSEFDSPLRTAVMIVEILGQSDLQNVFTPHRRMFLQTLSDILDSSSCLQLLMATVRVVGNWLSDFNNGPLTAKERNSFIWKMTSFDYTSLPDVVSQPLVDLISQFVIVFFEQMENSLEQSENQSKPLRLSDDEKTLISRSLASCLLTADEEMRTQVLSLYFSRNEGNSNSKPAMAFNPPKDVLWQLLHSDFEGVGGRNWTIIFVELFLSNLICLSTVSNATKVKSHPRRRLPPPIYETSSSTRRYLSDSKSFEESLSVIKTDLKNGGIGFCKSLTILVHGNSDMARALFLSLLPQAWASIELDSSRQQMLPPMESLLSRSFHSQFLKNGSCENRQNSENAVKDFLTAIGLMAPMPVLDIDLLISLAESYTCWYEILTILEHQFVALSAKTLTKEETALQQKVLFAMRYCYKELGESSVEKSLALLSCGHKDTHRACSFAIHGEVDKALETYTSLVELVDSESDISDFEMKFIEENWINLQRQQCQGKLVAEYAKSTSNPQLLLESSWKQRDWEAVRSLFASPSLVAAVESGDASVKICETLLAVANGKLSDVENLHAQTAQLCLHKWQLLPKISQDSQAHSTLLHFFHRLVEIRESGQIMVETKNHSSRKTLPDLKNLLNAWRYRLPNDNESLEFWDEIFTWRSHMFNAITSNFSWSEPSALATLHDRPWTSMRMAMTARKQNMSQASLLLLDKASESGSISVSDAYLKLREQILTYNNPDSELERTGGLNLINSTNLSFFDASQKSELFRLKAIFLSSLRRTSKSNQAYCHSVQINPLHSKAWISWGGLCSSLATLTEKSAESAAKSGSTPESVKESKAAAAKKVSQYLAQAMGCYLEASQIDASERSRIHLPKCLWMLTKEVSQAPGLLCQTLENRGVKLPPWVWLPWIPQLLTGLCRMEGRAIKIILAKVVKAYPQAVYYSLRAFYLERRDVERAKGISATSSQHMPSVAYAEEMMSTLRRSHASLWSSLEAILEEIIVKFRPSYEEELLATISALLERAETHAEKQSLSDDVRKEDEEQIVASWSKTLSRIAAKFFRTTDTPATSRRDERVKKTTEFKRKYKEEFETDFKVQASEGQDAPLSPDIKPQFRLAEYITRLQKWKAKLESQVACTPKSLPLIESSHPLAMFAADAPDLWPGACNTKYLNIDDTTTDNTDDSPTRHHSTTSSSAAIARKAAFNAAVIAANAASREGVGGEYGGGSAAIEIPGQYCPNSSTTADIKPCPELHTKLQRFEPHVEVLRRNGQLVRRIGLFGSDGRSYRFLLQFAIPYWTRTDERTAQTNFIIDKFLRQSVVTARNNLSAQPTTAIPVAQRLRMTLDDESRVSLDDVIQSSNFSKQKLSDVPSTFLRDVERRLHDDSTTSQRERENIERTVRREVYDEVCQTKVDSKLFLRFIQERLEGPENLFLFKRAFTGQMASNSLFQFIFSVAERTPSRVVLLLNQSRVLSPDFRVSYSVQGFIEGHVIPFRMTPNIESLIGASYMEGRFIRAMAMVAGAIREHREDFDPILRLLMRDDILAWYSKSLAKSDSKTQELERQLIERVSKNVSLLHARFSECAPTSTKACRDGAIDTKIKELLQQSTSKDNLCMMPTNYHAWL